MIEQLRKRDACVLSVHKMWEDAGRGSLYLSTLTFPDPEPSVVEARRRFKSFRTNIIGRDKWPVVWSLQRGSRKKRIHYHFISPVRPNAVAMWAVMPGYGFGRYDVAEIKPEDERGRYYVSKYLIRDHDDDLAGFTTWGALNTHRVKLKHVQYGKIALRNVRCVPWWLISQLRRGTLADKATFERFKTLVESQEFQVSQGII